MLTLTLGTTAYDVARGTLTLPRVGNWIADRVLVNADAPITGAATVTLDGVDMPAHIQKSEMVAGMLQLRLVGGNGGLGNLADPDHYKGSTVSHVVRDLVAGAGENLSGACTQAVLDLALPAWTTLAVSAGELLQALADAASEISGTDVSWRVLYDGTVWLGTETWPACPADVRVLDADAANSSQLVGTDALGIWPGTTLGNRKIDAVVHEIGKQNRSTVYWSEPHL